MGFEVICTMTDDMADPARDIPKAIIVGGLSIAVIYLFAGFGIGAAVPAAFCVGATRKSGVVPLFVAFVLPFPEARLMRSGGAPCGAR